MSWNNCRNGKIKLLPRSFQFPSMPLPSLIRMWYCGDIPKNIPPYRMLRGSDVDYMKHGKSKLSSMKKLMGFVIRAATVVNRPNLIKREMLVNDTLLMYHAVKHMFHFESFL